MKALFKYCFFVAVATLLGNAVQAAVPLQAIFSVDNPAGNLGTARVRVLHASPDAPAVDILVQNSAAFTNLGFPDITDFASLPAGTYNVKVVPAGATSPVVIEANLPLAAGTDYTVIATGLLADIAPVILTATGGGPAPGNAWVRFFHGSPDAPAVDIAVVGGPVLFSNVAFQQSTDYLELPAWGTLQINRVFSAEAPIEGAYVDLWTTTSGGSFLAWGSVLDNKTSDPATIFPQ